LLRDLRVRAVEENGAVARRQWKRGGAVAKKQYDPLWEIVDEKVPLQGAEPDIDSVCPHCNVRVHIGPDLKSGAVVECGLCGSLSRIVGDGGDVSLLPMEPES
jgi:hypothetical protein